MSADTVTELYRGENLNVTITAYDDAGNALTMDGTYSIVAKAVRDPALKPDDVPFDLSAGIAGGVGVIAFDTAGLDLGSYKADALVTYPTGEQVVGGPWYFDILDPVSA